jgi:hypothetical protein
LPVSAANGMRVTLAVSALGAAMPNGNILLLRANIA